MNSHNHPFLVTRTDEIVVRNDQVVPMGGLETADLGFSDLLMELQVGKKKNSDGKRILLDGSIRGRAQPGRMLAIMGPSGAGKSSGMFLFIIR